jgi:hypothetical protein
MEGFMKHNKRNVYLASGVAIAIIAGGAYFAYSSYGRFTTPSQDADTTGLETTQSTSTADKDQVTPDEVVTYAVTELNKTEGSYFSLPDTVSYTITPAVDKSRIMLTTSAGQELYTVEVLGSTANETVYMNGRVKDGSTGKLRIEGLVGDKVVVTKEVGVVF